LVQNILERISKMVKSGGLRNNQNTEITRRKRKLLLYY